ncbi:hypothetical protein GGI35DRAFT_488994 [Trichoderma velutinum]
MNSGGDCLKLNGKKRTETPFGSSWKAGGNSLDSRATAYNGGSSLDNWVGHECSLICWRGLSLVGNSDSVAAIPHKYGVAHPLPPSYRVLDFSLSGLPICGDASQWILRTRIQSLRNTRVYIAGNTKDAVIRLSQHASYAFAGTPLKVEWTKTSPLTPSDATVARNYRTTHVATAIRFIEPSVYRDASLGPPSEDVSIPSSIVAHVGHPDQIYGIGAKFFQATSLWMPIVCRKRFYADALNPISPYRRGLILLALTMKLYCAPASENDNDEQWPLYQLVKAFYADVEATGPMSVHVLQAAVFIAIYEIDQAIYPSAYMSVGTCARYGTALGLNNLMTRRFGDGKPGLSWTEIEEHRRVWWAVLMLDRLLNVGDPGRPLATEDPTFDSFLPIDDKAFIEDTFQPEDAITVSAGLLRKTSIFGGLAQATCLLGQTIKSISSFLSPPGEKQAVRFEEDTAQLRRTLHAYVQMVEKWTAIRKIQYCPASAICYIALFLLQEHYWKQVGAATAQEVRSTIFYETKSAWEAICIMAKDPDVSCVDPPISRLAGEFSTLFRQMIYQTTAQLIMVGFGDPDADTKNKIDTLTGILQVMQPRWHLSTVLLNILEAKKAKLVSAASDLRFDREKDTDFKLLLST